jgi:hypothetical protein
VIGFENSSDQLVVGPTEAVSQVIAEPPTKIG